MVAETKKMKPEVSIIIPTFNEEKHIEKCMRSVLDQNFNKKYEIIICDGLSKDNTVSIIKTLQKKHKNVILLKNKERFQAQGRNLGIKHSKAKFIAYIDAHGYASKNWLSELYNSFHSLKRRDNFIYVQKGVSDSERNAGSILFSRCIL